MIFIVEDKNYSDDFLRYITEYIKKILYNSIQYRKLIRAEDYINSIGKYKSIYVRHISIRNIINSAISNIEYIRFTNRVCFRINPNVKVYGTDIGLVEIVKLITYGNRELRGYNVFERVFKIFAKNIDILLLNYNEQFRQKR